MLTNVVIKIAYICFCSNTKLGNQQIILFTNDGNPHRDSQTKQHQTRKKAEDLSQIGISLEVYFMGTLLDNIDKSFYKVNIMYEL